MKKRNLIIIICFVICLLFIIGLLFLKNNYYQFKSRVSNVEKMKNDDNNENPVVGWLQVQGTNIDYPIITELNEDPSSIPIKKYGWMMTGDNKYHNVVTIMGHNIMNLSSHPMIYDESFDRFESLAAFLYYDFAKENEYIQFTMNGKDYVYQIFSVGILDDYTVANLPIEDYSKKEMNYYLDLMKKNSIYNYHMKTKSTDNYITLFTCTRFYGKHDIIYVSGKQINNNRSSYYNIKKNKKYKKIEKVMNSGDFNDEDEI